jgi:signal peptidase
MEHELARARGQRRHVTISGAVESRNGSATGSVYDRLVLIGRAALRLARLVVALGVLAGFLTVAVAVLSGAWQVRPVLSGSMSPGIPTGSLVVTQRVPTSSLEVRDVAVFHPPGEPTIDYVHRIISLRREGGAIVIRTQGDANRYPDPWTLRVTSAHAYVARFAVPFLGYVAVWVHSPAGRRDLLIGAGLLAALLVASVLFEQRLARRRTSLEGQVGVCGECGCQLHPAQQETEGRSSGPPAAASGPPETGTDDVLVGANANSSD